MSVGAKIGEAASRGALGDEEVREFFEQVDGLYDGLGDREKIMLAAIVVEALGDEEDGSGEDGESAIAPPIDDELAGFAEKLNAFHDSLPGDQHLLLDELLGRSWFKDEAEVEGYRWRLIDRRRVPWGRWREYMKVCESIGGRGTWGKQRGDGPMLVACWKWVD